MAQVSNETKQKIAATLLDCGLLKFGEFKLKSGIMSPFYIDLRKAQSYPEAFHTITDVYSEMIEDLDSSVLLAGVPEAATPLAAAVGYRLKRALVQPRKVVKEYGTKSSVEGEYKEGDSVVLIDDLITKGDSKIEAIEQVQAAGLKVEKLIILIDREQGGVETVAKAGHTIEAAFTITELLDILLELGKIEQSRYDEVLEFIKNN
ncbi:MAG: uridine monophosphate synthetase [Patescibacteria group bacterium]|nr:uridine monophosphate synthetase [Patescibacteria group bacterium]